MPEPAGAPRMRILPVLLALLLAVPCPAAVVNVKTAGAKGDGVTNDTPAIQAAFNAYPSGTEFYFPAGIYSVADLHITNGHTLLFRGDGAASVLQYRAPSSSYNPIITFQGGSGLTLQDLAVDNKGITTYGGVVFRSVTDVLIQRTYAYDSAPKPIAGYDRYAYVFTADQPQNQRIKVLDNRIDSLQLEVDNATEVDIHRNVVRWSCCTGAIGLFTIIDQARMSHYRITENVIEDPVAAGIAVHIDPVSRNGAVIEDILIARNQFLRTRTAGREISLGTMSSATCTMGNQFRHITIQDNVFRVMPAAPP